MTITKPAKPIDQARWSGQLMGGAGLGRARAARAAAKHQSAWAAGGHRERLPKP